MTKTNKIYSYISIILLLIVVAACSKNLIISEGKTHKEKDENREVVSVFLDDKLMKFSEIPVVKDDKVYVSVNEFTKKIGAKTRTNKPNQIVIKKDDKNLVIDIKESTAITEENKNFFITSISKGKKTLLPIDIIANHFGLSVSDLAKNTIKIYSDSNKIEGKADKDEEVVEEETENLHSKLAYLTFDDGPNVNTPAILDILKEKNVKATFFMLGANIISHKDIAKRLSDEGHGLGVHSMTHDKKMVYTSPYSFLSEMTRANDALYEATGKKTLLLRAPYGSKPYMNQETRDLAVSWGYRIWDWNVDSSDSIKKKTAPEEVYNEVVSQVANKDEAVILFHDKEHTLEALPKIIDHLVENGFEIKKIDKTMTPMNFWKDIR